MDDPQPIIKAPSNISAMTTIDGELYIAVGRDVFVYGMKKTKVKKSLMQRIFNG